MDELFRFKNFSVHNAETGQKVGTDGVLLGVLTTLPEQGEVRVLDIGTGTGIVALMLAQRLEQKHSCSFKITAIEIDKKAAEQAELSFRESPWQTHLSCLNTSLQDYADSLYRADGAVEGLFDLIISNPPYFEDSLKCPEEARTAARHTDSLSYREVISFAGDFLSKTGSVCVILPKEEEQRIKRFAASFGFVIKRQVNVRTTEKKAPKRIVVELIRHNGTTMAPYITTLTMISADGSFTEEYGLLTKDFYLCGQ